MVAQEWDILSAGWRSRLASPSVVLGFCPDPARVETNRSATPSFPQRAGAKVCERRGPDFTPALPESGPRRVRTRVVKLACSSAPVRTPLGSEIASHSATPPSTRNGARPCGRLRDPGLGLAGVSTRQHLILDSHRTLVDALEPSPRNREAPRTIRHTGPCTRRAALLPGVALDRGRRGAVPDRAVGRTPFDRDRHGDLRAPADR